MRVQSVRASQKTGTFPPFFRVSVKSAENSKPLEIIEDPQLLYNSFYFFRGEIKIGFFCIRYPQRMDLMRL